MEKDLRFMRNLLVIMLVLMGCEAVGSGEDICSGLE